MSSFIEIPPQSEEVSHHAYIIGVNERTDGRTAGQQTRKQKPLAAYYWRQGLKITLVSS